jgi:hypothetical protein
MTAFVALLTSLPTGNSTIRMRVWRSLKTTGCAVLRDGVYVLPQAAPQAATLEEAASAVRAVGGFAMTTELNLRTPAQSEYVHKLFDRAEEYGALVVRIGAARASLRRLGKRKAETLVQPLRRAFEDLVAIDFYPGPAQAQASAALSGLEAEMQRTFSVGEPHSARGKLRRLHPARYRHRVWATRKDLWVDRLASAWLIRRFIDREARFVWFERPRDRPKGSIGFDFDGATFTHVESRVTFETLLASFGLDHDPALASLGHAVHFLDVGGIPVADAKGLETILRGIKAKSRSDDETLAEASKVFELFYAAYVQRASP